MIFNSIKYVNMGLAFLLELGVLVALGYWGFQVGQGMLMKILPGIGLPVLAIIVWGILGAPKSSWQLQGIWYLALQVVFFGSAALALFSAGRRDLGIAFALLFVLNVALTRILG
ncbi:DUF2568 domain-containing protein [Ktedonosporobacter rubrisoli]|uniref:DUF2568 domain-containing protein n=1 Tax=Ktedonosporobacter rubrisoli TaxID=2509675 RepID=A0A4P6JP26_KTERU|nr:YrdB family protein [Ktedonosporobacter rubrisoli]QBD77097.1 DUF2568 domain-containing protein [Ktedonosporobacter rubrisoli]